VSSGEASRARPRGAGAQLAAFASLVKLSHTVFGLPFALAAAALAHRWARAQGDVGLDAWRVLLIIVAFAGARAAAMGFNRIVDRRFDAANPRTADREIPRGIISLPAAWALTIASIVIFCGAAALLGRLPALLAPACLVVLLGYSLFKRWSWSSHLVLGLALALAPGGAWIAVTGGFAGIDVPLHLMIAVATWVAGFDILYALQDESFDRAHGLHSIPARFGTVGALVISAALHVGTVAALVVVHLHAGMGPLHAIGIAGIAIVLAWEHAIVKPGDLSRLNRAFFDLNGWVSLGYLAAVLADLAIG
jgi:4-hydroxybenzoate polyprenyltransferase